MNSEREFFSARKCKQKSLTPLGDFLNAKFLQYEAIFWWGQKRAVHDTQFASRLFFFNSERGSPQKEKKQEEGNLHISPTF